MLTAQWRKSSRSNTNGACLEVRLVNDHVQVRDSKHHGHGPILSFTIPEWKAFVEGVADGEFAAVETDDGAAK